jgi:hypothetical protein
MALTPASVKKKRDLGWKKRKRLWLGLIAGGAAVIVGVGGWQAVSLLTATCGGGTSSYQGECVGVTDGSYVFDPSLAAIENTIKRQNAQAQATGDYVSIALLTPLTSTPGSDVTPSRVQQQLEGAATAQAYLNGKQDFKPAIQLLLANEGSQQQAWPQVVGQLQDWPAGQDLVAVVGVGLSTTGTVLAARQLASGTRPLPMIGSVDTGDGLNTSGPQPPLVPSALSGRISGLVRVEPSVADEVTLLSQYYLANLKKPADNKKPSGNSVQPHAALSQDAVLVYDNDPSDLYTGSLKLDFSRQFEAHIIDEKQFAPGEPSGEFASIANDVCPPGATSTPVVLYAGRESVFPDFIQKLSTYTNCPSGSTITVLTGADAESLDPARTGSNPGGPAIDVVYPNIADSGQLAPWYRQAFEGPPADMSASWAIMTFDAVTAAEQAARQASQASSTLLTPSAVTSLLYDFNKLTDPVEGATGPFVITLDGDEGCQWIPLIIDQNGTPKVLSQTRPGCPAS